MAQRAGLGDRRGDGPVRDAEALTAPANRLRDLLHGPDQEVGRRRAALADVPRFATGGATVLVSEVD
jgi:hypothetical protein